VPDTAQNLPGESPVPGRSRAEGKEKDNDAPVVCSNFMDSVVEKGNLGAAPKKVERNGGNPGKRQHED